VNEIQKQVGRVQRRLLFQRFVQLTSWLLFAALFVASIAVLIPKIWAVSFLDQPATLSTWSWTWVAGTAALALIASIVISIVTRKSQVQAAIELDIRYGLKERVSSALALDTENADSPAGKALVQDAVRRVERIDVGEKFKMRSGWKTLLPMLPALIIFVLMTFVPNVEMEKTVDADTIDVDSKERIKESTVELRKQIRKQRLLAQSNADKEAEALFKEIESQLDKLDSDQTISKKKALIQLNNIKEQLADRKKQLGDASALKKQLSQLGKINQGPADDIANAMKRGEYKKAADAIQKLADKLAQDELTEEEKKDLAQQLNQLQKNLQEMAKKHEQKKEDLKQQLAQAKQEGDQQKAQQLQNQLDQMNQQNPQMQQMKQMAQQMGECAECLQKADGDPAQQAQQMAQAQEALQQMQQQMQGMQNEMEQLKDLEQAIAGVGECKESVNGGMGEMQASMGQGGKASDQPGQGMGEGKGEGDRPEEASDYNSYNSRVAAKPTAGEAITLGNADGENISGTSRVETQKMVDASLTNDEDPLADQRLPRRQREHAKEYFENFRQGKKN